MLASCWRVRGPEGNDFVSVMSQVGSQPTTEGNSGSWSVHRGGAAPGNTWGWRSLNEKNASFLRWLVIILWNRSQLAPATRMTEVSMTTKGIQIQLIFSKSQLKQTKLTQAKVNTKLTGQPNPDRISTILIIQVNFYAFLVYSAPLKPYTLGWNCSLLLYCNPELYANGKCNREHCYSWVWFSALFSHPKSFQVSC